MLNITLKNGIGVKNCNYEGMILACFVEVWMRVKLRNTNYI